METEEQPEPMEGEEPLPEPGEDDGSEGETLVDPGAPEGAPEVDDDEEQLG